MKEIGLHGRGGQGIVLSGEMLAGVYFYEGYEVQFMPSYGAERRGSPSNAYVRVEKDQKIYNRYAVEIPDEVVVFNMGLLQNIKVKQNGTVLLNASGDIQKQATDAKIFVVDANSIALSLNLGTPAMPIINTALLGAYCRVAGDFSFDNLAKVITQKIGKRADINIEAAKLAYDNVREL
jgi:2-oxoisovalerate ferredoxin oxidoreductase gamma subunit